MAPFYNKIIGKHVCFVKERTCDSGERDIKISANALEVFHIFLLLISQLKEVMSPYFYQGWHVPRFEFEGHMKPIIYFFEDHQWIIPTKLRLGH